jgi:hypothetical protein
LARAVVSKSTSPTPTCNGRRAVSALASIAAARNLRRQHRQRGRRMLGNVPNCDSLNSHLQDSSPAPSASPAGQDRDPAWRGSNHVGYVRSLPDPTSSWTCRRRSSLDLHRTGHTSSRHSISAPQRGMAVRQAAVATLSSCRGLGPRRSPAANRPPSSTTTMRSQVNRRPIRHTAS